MPDVLFVGASRKDDDNSQNNPARLLNCYRERSEDGFVIKSVLGMEDFATLTGVFMREMEEVGGVLYAAHGGKIYSVDAGGNVTTTGTITDASDTTIDGNNNAITVAAGGTYYSISGGVTATPATGAITSVGSVSFLGQRTILTEKGGAKIQWSDVADPETFDALNFATAESRDDNVIRGMVVNGQYWVFGERSIERWYVTGSTDPALFIQPIASAVVDIGLKAFGLLSKFPGGAFMVGSDNIAYLLSGGELRPISSASVNTSLKQANPERCFYYEDEGQKFCVIKFEDRPSWVYDLSTDEWHERAEGELFGSWSAVASAQAYGESFVGTQLGGIYKLTRSNEDRGAPLWRRMVSRTYENSGNRFVVNRLQLRPRTGRADLGREGKVMVRLSRDRGETWGPEKQRSLGALGEYDKIVSLRSLGQFRRLNVEVTTTDMAEIPMNAVGVLEVS